MRFSRRELLATTACFFAGTLLARAGEIAGELPWAPNSLNPPTPVRPGPWQFFTFDEAKTVEALVDRIIPPDPQTPGGKDAGCAIYLDRQLAGPYGSSEGHFNQPPFTKGVKSQGSQSEGGPAKTYRDALAALDRYCRGQPGGAPFAQLSDQAKDDLLKDLEDGKVELSGVDGKEFFIQLVKDVQDGFFADPIYGGNRDMVAWKMIGFPGARYNYLDWIDRHNERYPLPPVSLLGRAEWTPNGG